MVLLSKTEIIITLVQGTMFCYYKTTPRLYLMVLNTQQNAQSVCGQSGLQDATTAYTAFQRDLVTQPPVTDTFPLLDFRESIYFHIEFV